VVGFAWKLVGKWWENVVESSTNLGSMSSMFKFPYFPKNLWCLKIAERLGSWDKCDVALPAPWSNRHAELSRDLA